MEPIFLEATSEGHKDDWEQPAQVYDAQAKPGQSDCLFVMR